jgi:hypothetical protein
MTPTPKKGKDCLSKLRADFEAHVKDKAQQLTDIRQGIAEIKNNLTTIRINGDERDYTLPEAFSYMAELLAIERAKHKFRERWILFRDSRKFLHFLFGTVRGKFLVAACVIYFWVSILDDIGIAMGSPLKVTSVIIRAVARALGVSI